MKIIETDSILIEENRIFVTNKVTGEQFAPLKHDGYDTDTTKQKLNMLKL